MQTIKEYKNIKIEQPIRQRIEQHCEKIKRDSKTLHSRYADLLIDKESKLHEMR